MTIDVKMQDIGMRNCAQPITIEEITEFERTINAKLPNDYVEHLLQYNGGGPKKNKYDLIEPINQEDSRSNEEETFVSIDKFYSLKHGHESETLERNYNIFEDILPPELIPIGRDGGGNRICLCVRGNNYGKVYFWLEYLFWEREIEEDENGKMILGKAHLAANSFTEFVNKLYEYVLPDDILESIRLQQLKESRDESTEPSDDEGKDKNEL